MPDGQEKKCFYQRHAGSGSPGAAAQVKVPGFDDPYLYIEDCRADRDGADGGAGMHPVGSDGRASDRPDRIIFDLDPDEGLGFSDVISAALDVRERLEALGLTASSRRRRQGPARRGADRAGDALAPRPRRLQRSCPRRCRRTRRIATLPASPRRRGRGGYSSTTCATIPPRPRSALIRPAPGPERRSQRLWRWEEVGPELDPSGLYAAARFPHGCRRRSRTHGEGSAPVRQRLPGS
jgi:hypothetical protein